MCEVWLPCIGIEHRGAALIEPVDLLFAEKKDAAEHDFSDAIGMSFRIREGEGGTPRSAEHLPALDAEVLAEFLDIRHQIPGGVGFERRVGCAFATATLVEVYDAVLPRVEEAPLLRIGTAAWAAV
jgi:hypothetical protein